MLLGCAHHGGVRLEAREGALEGDIGGAFTVQTLFRVDLESPEGSGRLRLVLRDDPQGEAEAFYLAASDPLGRPVWSFATSGRRVGLVDHRREAYCESREAIRLPEAGLAALPPSALPRLLRGLLPVEPPATRGADVDFRDDSGRRWTAKLAAGEPESWTLWGGGRPILWFRRQSGGGILSHHDGSQFRWRRSVSEERQGNFVLVIPEGYHAADCATWELSQLRQDQPAPAGHRPPP